MQYGINKDISNFNDRIYETQEREREATGYKSPERKSWNLNKCVTTKLHETDQRLLLWNYNIPSAT